MLHLPMVPQHYASCLALQYLLLVHQETCVLLWRKTDAGLVRQACDCFDGTLNDGTRHHFCVGNASEMICRERMIRFHYGLVMLGEGFNTRIMLLNS